MTEYHQHISCIYQKPHFRFERDTPKSPASFVILYTLASPLYFDQYVHTWIYTYT
ncbi:hypothetical protein [Pontibacter mucosus]|uniref:hypothetical protein n=1 Tax=Pontibacter mucosus TaxID=1649266 RepID=UPI001474CD60|nr:hypothetical protein [Pontibacter mucosus]